jgi:hypothetical protein
VKSTNAALSASTLMICRAVIWPRGFTQSAAAVSGEIWRPVVGSSVRTCGGAWASWSKEDGSLAFPEGELLRHEAKKRAR